MPVRAPPQRRTAHRLCRTDRDPVAAPPTGTRSGSNRTPTAKSWTCRLSILDSDSQDLFVGIQHEALGASVRVRPTDVSEEGSPDRLGYSNMARGS